MRNLFKKSLAFCLVAALALTCFVGTFTVSAAETATITVAADPIAAPTADTEVPVTLTISSPSAGINVAKLAVTTAVGTFAKAPTVAEANVYVEKEMTDDFDTFLVSAKNTDDGEGNTQLGAFNTATVTLYVTVPANTVAGTYEIDVKVLGVNATTPNEVVVDLVYPTKGAIVIEDSHTHTWSAFTLKAGTDNIAIRSCSCGETEEKPLEVIDYSTTLFNHTLAVREVVYDIISINNTSSSGIQYLITNLSYNKCDFVINYEYYDGADKYNIKTKQAVCQEVVNGSNTVKYTFNLVPLHSIALNYDVVFYFYNADGLAAMYKRTTSIAQEAKAVFDASSDATMKKTITDMLVYGEAVRTYFAAGSGKEGNIADADAPKATDLLTPVDANDLTKGYMYQSTDEDLKTSYNNTNGWNDTTDFGVHNSNLKGANITAKVQSSNVIYYRMGIAVAYEKEKLSATFTYKNGYGEEITSGDVYFANCFVSGTEKNNTYEYDFKKLAIYDMDKVITTKFMYNGEVVGVYEYSFGNFVNEYINQDNELGRVAKYGILFAQSVRYSLFDAQNKEYK